MPRPFSLQLAAGVSARRNLQFDDAGRRRCLHGPAERRFPRRHGQIEIQVAAVDPIQGVRLEFDLDVEIAAPGPSVPDQPRPHRAERHLDRRAGWSGPAECPWALGR